MGVLERTDLRFDRADLRPERMDLRPKMGELRSGTSEKANWAEATKGTKSCRTQGTVFVRSSLWASQA